MSEHTKEPWAIDPDDRLGMEWNNHIVSVANPDRTICFMSHDGTAENIEFQANARRIVYCVNACAGMTTEEIEADIVVGGYRALLACSDSVIATLEQRVAALTKERDELEISNAFAHGEWRAVKDQLAALTTERNEAIYQTKVATQEHFDMEQELAASQAREAKLREHLHYYRQRYDGVDNMDSFPTDDSVLQERLKEERERCAQIAEDATAYTQFQTVEHYKISRSIANAIRGLA